MDIKPNPGCANSLCRQMQQAYQQHQASPAEQQRRQAAEQAAALQQEEPAAHDDNEWGIEVVSQPANAQPLQQSSANGGTQQQSRSYDHGLPEGLQYETPVSVPALICLVPGRRQSLLCSWSKLTMCNAICQLQPRVTHIVFLHSVNYSVLQCHA